MTTTMTRDAFVAATGDAGWADIESLVSMLDDADFWDEAFLADAIDAQKKAYIRREIRQVKGPDGWPLFASTVTTNPITGEDERRYKQEALFDRDDYMQVVRFHRERSSYHARMAEGYADRGRERYGMQIPMPLEPDPISPRT